MFECLILGDSIAVGLHQQRPDCSIVAKSGINTRQFNRTYHGEFFSNIVVISLGSNDSKGIQTRKELEELRKRVLAKSRVVWILPSGTGKNSGVNVVEINNMILSIAEVNGDMVVSPHPKYMSSDGIHPTRTGYVWLESFISGTTGMTQK